MMDLQQLEQLANVTSDIPVLPQCMRCMDERFYNIETVHVFCKEHARIEIKEVGDKILVHIYPKEPI